VSKQISRTFSFFHPASVFGSGTQRIDGERAFSQKQASTQGVFWLAG
jgi:hypothetical protein